MDIGKLTALDIHGHAEHSCRQPLDPIHAEFEAAASVYFRTDGKRPSIPETIAHYRARNIGF